MRSIAAVLFLLAAVLPCALAAQGAPHLPGSQRMIWRRAELKPNPAGLLAMKKEVEAKVAAIDRNPNRKMSDYQALLNGYLAAWKKDYGDTPIYYKMALASILCPFDAAGQEFKQQLVNGYYEAAGYPHPEYVRVMFIVSGWHEVFISENGYLADEPLLEEVYRQHRGDAMMKEAYVRLMRYGRGFLKRFDDLIQCCRDLRPAKGQMWFDQSTTQLWLDRALKTKRPDDISTARKLAVSLRGSPKLEPAYKKTLDGYIRMLDDMAG